ncbi:prepilin-type N-terminal cleavage/methylation domain-containing protein [Mesobacillus subterraneus]|uniref:PulJ/GspJ family protein n=1 Tax=Mesobacillus subterraneus TaxID=285983 RepID=UPI001CFEDBE2|nr:prepilin-type N-terminal cleavage/methylation domain-containing protein [Mesobacillus subterraneus]WLR56179.1 prepilin-type N-terminal cleavage/methylation domain-containing protein [Mesobacillus subterraneus]
MKRILKESQGLTLIEVLMVITISSIIAGVAYSILFSSMTSTKSTLSDTNLRNEAVLVTQQFDALMKNIDGINTVSLDTPLKKVELSNKKADLDSSGKLQSVTQLTTFEIKSDDLHMSFYENGILVTSKVLNSRLVSMKKTTFKVTELVSGSKKKKALHVLFQFEENETGNTKIIEKIYRLQSE